MSTRESDTTQRTLISPGPETPESRGACIVIIHGEGMGRRLDIEDRAVVIGRDSACDLHILHPSVSRRHCRIHQENGLFWVQDLGSTNATRVNDRVIDRAELSDGDHLTIGESILKFIGDSSVEASYHEEIYQLASHDELTGFFNRRLFLELFERELVRTRNAQWPLAFAILDIDWFKRINDTYGHQAGDLILQKVAQTIRQKMRDQDIVGRIGGEEFGLLLPGLSPRDVLAHAQVIRQAVEDATYLLAEAPQIITISIGLAQRCPSQDDRPNLMRAADTALYQAKQNGRNQVVFAASSETPTA